MGAYLEEMERRKAITALLTFILCSAALLWHGPSFALAVVTLCAGAYLITTAFRLWRLRRDQRGSTTSHQNSDNIGESQ
jgi:threonine/homoserine/homoserine lactone efflux protein